MPEDRTHTRIIYLHGFNSSPDSQKAQAVSRYFAEAFADKIEILDLIIPVLPYDPKDAIALLEGLIEEVDRCVLIGSSLGGYYSIYLAEKYQLKAILINPAVSFDKKASEGFLGFHTNDYTGEEFELNGKHMDFFNTLHVDVIQYPQNFFLLVQTGDEVIDYQRAVKKFSDGKQIVQDGGDHSFVDFATVLPEIFQFTEVNI